MSALLLRWGIDPIQWRALVRALLRIDFPMTVKTQNNQERRQIRGSSSSCSSM